MCLSSKVRDLRDTLLQNCDEAISRLRIFEQSIIIKVPQSSDKQPEASSSRTSPSDPSTNTTSSTLPAEAINVTTTDPKIANDYMVLTHGVLIQEWEHFLYDIFIEGVIYYLKGDNLGDPDHKLRLKSLKPTVEEAERRKNISAEVKNAKSLWGKELFTQCRKLFKVPETELLKEMQKQEQVRHVFQHNRGIIRKEDLVAIGTSGVTAHFDILNDKEETVQYYEKQSIVLSKKEIQKLRDTVVKYSQLFQTQAENCEKYSLT